MPSLTRSPTALSPLPSPSTSTQSSSTALSFETAPSSAYSLSASPAPSSSTSSSPTTAVQYLPDLLDGLDQEQLELHQFDPLDGSQQQQQQQQYQQYLPYPSQLHQQRQQVYQIYPPSHQAQNHHVCQQDYNGQMPPLQHPSQQHQQQYDSSYHSSQSQPQQQPKSSFAAGPIVMQALDMARESQEAEGDPKISALLDGALAEVVARVWAAPDSYVMQRDEFAVFNFFQCRFDKTDEVYMSARRRYWNFPTA